MDSVKLKKIAGKKKSGGMKIISLADNNGGYVIEAHITAIRKDPSIPNNQVKLKCLSTIQLIEGNVSMDTTGSNGIKITLPGIDNLEIKSKYGVGTHTSSGGGGAMAINFRI